LSAVFNPQWPGILCCTSRSCPVPSTLRVITNEPGTDVCLFLPSCRLRGTMSLGLVTQQGQHKLSEDIACRNRSLSFGTTRAGERPRTPAIFILKTSINAALSMPSSWSLRTKWGVSVDFICLHCSTTTQIRLPSKRQWPVSEINGSQP
jgi:hypothetical protein